MEEKTTGEEKWGGGERRGGLFVYLFYLCVCVCDYTRSLSTTFRLSIKIVTTDLVHTLLPPPRPPPRLTPANEQRNT